MTTTMGRNVEKILKRVSTTFITIGTAITVAIILQSPENCISPSRSNTHFPRSTCDSNAAKASSSIDEERSDLGFLRKHMKALGLSAGGGHAPMSICQIGVSDEQNLINFLFFEDVFDFAFTAHLDESLFPRRFAAGFAWSPLMNAAETVLETLLGSSLLKFD